MISKDISLRGQYAPKCVKYQSFWYLLKLPDWGQHAPKQSAAAACFSLFKKRTFLLSDKGAISAEMTE
jgi:hypothetical protein